MERITVVLEGAAEPVHLEKQMAGGRVVAAAIGDLITCEDPDLLTPKQLEAGLMAIAAYLGPACLVAVIEAIDKS